LIGRFGRLEHLIYETLESIVIPGFVLSLGMENIDMIQEAFKFTRFGSILFVVSRPFHHVDRMIHFPLLIVTLGRARLVRVARLLLLLLLSGVEGRLLCLSIFIGDSQHLF
jgi:hypothetical protein